MSCRAILALVLVVCGCADDVDYIRLRAAATEVIELEPTGPLASVSEATYRWELVSAPAASRGPLPVPDRDDPAARFVPDVRGDYVIERWIVYGLGEELSHAFIVETIGQAPHANAIVASSTIDVDVAAVIDGSTSTSAENLPLTYQWRLMLAPEGSTATLMSVTGATTSLVADVPGGYVIALSVFDGELWCQMPSLVVVNAQ